MPRSRRALLRTSGTALAALAVAGCLGGDAPATDAPESTPTDTPTDSPTATATPTSTATDTATSTETVTESPTDTPTDTPAGTPPGAPTDYPDWLPAPSAVGRDHYAITSLAVRSLHDLQDEFADGAGEQFTGEFPIPGVDTWGSVLTLHQVARGATVTRTDLSRETVESGISDADVAFTEAGTYRGFTTFDADGQAYAAVGDALGGTAVVMSGVFGSPANPQRFVEATVGAHEGVTEHYTAASADFDRLVRAVGPAHLFRARTHEPGEGLDGSVAAAFAYYLDSEESEVRTPVVFPGGSVDESVVAEWAADADIFRDQSPATSVDGRVVTAEATLATGDIARFTGSFPGEGIDQTAPTAAFSFEYEETGDAEGTLSITHDGGDSIPVAELYVRGSGFAAVDGVDQTKPGQWRGTASGDENAVVAGDAVEVGVTSDYEISVVWESADEQAAATLASGQGPDA
jgi:hypothetical protein